MRVIGDRPTRWSPSFSFATTASRKAATLGPERYSPGLSTPPSSLAASHGAERHASVDADVLRGQLGRPSARHSTIQMR